jgi:hypothetical protein
MQPAARDSYSQSCPDFTFPEGTEQVPGACCDPETAKIVPQIVLPLQQVQDFFVHKLPNQWSAPSEEERCGGRERSGRGEERGGGCPHPLFQSWGFVFWCSGVYPIPTECQASLGQGGGEYL